MGLECQRKNQNFCLSIKEIEELIKKICCNANYINIMFQTRIDEFYEMVFQVIKSDDKCEVTDNWMIITDLKNFKNGRISCF